jgi:hypothetical protein
VSQPNDDDPLADLPWPSAENPPPEVQEAIRHTCTDDLTPKTCCSLRRRLAMSIAISVVLFAILLMVGWTRHPPKSAVTLALVVAALWAVVQASVLLVGCGRPPGKRGYPYLRWLVTAVVVSAFFAQLTLGSTSQLAFDQFLVAPRSLRGTVVCGIHSILFGSLSMASLLWVWRRTDPFTPRLSGALMGLAGGLVGAIALDMVCASREAWHLWLGHGAALLVMVLAGWLLGRRCLTP